MAADTVRPTAQSSKTRRVLQVFDTHSPISSRSTVKLFTCTLSKVDCLIFNRRIANTPIDSAPTDSAPKASAPSELAPMDKAPTETAVRREHPHEHCWSDPSSVHAPAQHPQAVELAVSWCPHPQDLSSCLLEESASGSCSVFGSIWQECHSRQALAGLPAHFANSGAQWFRLADPGIIQGSSPSVP